MGLSAEDANRLFEQGKTNKEIAEAHKVSAPYVSKLRGKWKAQQGKKKSTSQGSVPRTSVSYKAGNKKKTVKKVMAKLKKIQGVKPPTKPQRTDGISLTLEGDFVVFRVPVMQLGKLIWQKMAGKVFG